MSGKQKKDHRGRASDDPFWKGCGKRIGFAPLNKEKEFGASENDDRENRLWCHRCMWLCGQAHFIIESRGEKAEKPLD